MEQAFRVLNIYDKLLKNETVNKLELATEFNVNPRTIQRDIDNIRHYLYESTLHSDLELQIQFEQSKIATLLNVLLNIHIKMTYVFK